MAGDHGLTILGTLVGLMTAVVVFAALFGFTVCTRDAFRAHFFSVVVLEVVWGLVMILLVVDFLVFAFGKSFLFSGDGLARLLFVLSWWDAADNFQVLDEWYVPLMHHENAELRRKSRVQQVFSGKNATTPAPRPTSRRLGRMDSMLRKARKVIPKKPSVPLTRPIVLSLYFAVLFVLLWRTQTDEEREPGWLSLVSVWIAVPHVLYKILSGEERKERQLLRRNALRKAANGGESGPAQADALLCESCGDTLPFELPPLASAILWLLWLVVAATIAGISLKHAPLGWHAVLLLWFWVPSALPHVLERVSHFRDVRTSSLDGPKPTQTSSSWTPEKAGYVSRLNPLQRQRSSRPGKPATSPMSVTPTSASVAAAAAIVPSPPASVRVTVTAPRSRALPSLPSAGAKTRQRSLSASSRGSSSPRAGGIGLPSSRASRLSRPLPASPGAQAPPPPPRRMSASSRSRP